MSPQTAKRTINEFFWIAPLARVGFLQLRPDPRHEMAALLRDLGATVESPEMPPWKPLSVPRVSAVVPD